MEHLVQNIILSTIAVGCIIAFGWTMLDLVCEDPDPEHDVPCGCECCQMWAAKEE